MIMELFLAHGTEKAHFFMMCQKQTTDMVASRELGAWIPKKCCTILEKDEDKAWHWNRCKVDVKDWFAKQAGLVAKQAHVIKHHVKFDPERDEII